MKDLKELIKKQLLPGLAPDGFINYKNKLIIDPVDDLLKGFCFDRHDERLYVHLFVQPLYIPSGHIVLSYGWRLRGSGPLGVMFLLNNEQIDFTIAEVKRLLLAEKSILLETRTTSDFLNTFLLGDVNLISSRNEKDIRYQEALTYTQAYIQPEKATALIDKFLRIWEADPYKKVDWMKEVKNNMLLLKQSSGSVEEVKLLFDKWKTFTASNLKLSGN